MTEINSLPVFDRDHFESLVEDDTDLREQILSLFLSHLAQDFRSLCEAHKAANHSEWHEWLHKIGGACSNLRADEMATLCRQGKNVSTDKDREVFHAKITAAYNNLHREIANALKS